MTVSMLHARRAQAIAARGAIAVCAAALAYGVAIASAVAAPAIAQFGAPKYPAGFTHFAYADPDAPDDGTLAFQNYNEAQSYDSLNPFLVRGSPAPDIKNLMFDTLMQRSWDELASEYALIADDVQVAPDGLSATFHIDPAARFSNGDPITADDVKYSFDTLSGPQASPLFNAQFSVIRRAVVVDGHTVRFEFKHAERDAALIAGDLPVFSPKWGMRADGTRPPFDQIATVPPIASGPYLIEQRKNDKQIVYVRNPRYWAANLPSRRGMYRFARVSFKLYLDQYTMLEAFKAGDIDARMEYSATQWARRYVGRNLRNGMLKQGEFPDGPAQMQGFLINLRKPQFADVRVRHALTLAFDYDWMNRMMFYGQYRRTDSFWAASPFGAKGMPSERELALLAPYRAELPAEVFGPMIRPPSTLPPGSLRANLKQARDLLAQAGWHFRDGALRDANGTPMTIEIIDDQPGMDRLILPYIQALGTLGIRASLHELDSALYQRRLDNFQYDMTTFIYSPVTIPGAELARRFGSAAASQVGSENYPGVKSKAVDALIRAALAADTLDDLETATHALDRVLINLYILVPHYYLPNARIAYKASYGHPAIVPDSYQYEDWIISYWYRKKPAGAARVSGT
ncbi:extracellular solute-binding protein [Burkholderia cepacia]|uniref:ABC transporter substrate-binding protein n=3 Tax=Burkholderia cepacia TaxID=292 RepID=A0ABM6P0R8_BURCE|nr:extracellular solute-binding protein [Burkholderia cepacia]AIO26776.1 bacterial extracellular solute-binding s, 5 Middle family protein [Burkholderia cepacia ATCC 25416]ALK23621.1 peptide ABC transporter substrate-binding protein [Burkholderia cepacia ATCC 25416]ASE93195.1 ABC transporter substrate-binding protein [Burkholderia cepacia]ATF80632.1 ABC transporter substrate-binding protein [Burkholderia cepacia]MCA8471414.1 extracellular solute-binding protein [Burkholderia cepacia]